MVSWMAESEMQAVARGKDGKARVQKKARVMSDEVLAWLSVWSKEQTHGPTDATAVPKAHHLLTD